MSVKTDVLEMLENNRGIHLSGAAMAKELGVSRNAVWKAIKTLETDGYNIEGVNNKGYCLSCDTDVLSRQGIDKYLSNNVRKVVNIESYKTIDSTNTEMKKLAVKGEKEWKIIVAEEQTNGRGRMNREFYSPAKTGIYMSILFRPDFSASESLFVTTMAAVAVANAIEEVLGLHTQIKWVNDIYYQNKKVCGILTEAALNVENGKLDYAVLGIGINVLEPQDQFPDNIKNIASSLISSCNENEDIRCRLCASVINNIYSQYSNIQSHSFMEEYKKRSLLIGKDVIIVGDENKELLHVEDIDENAALVVRHKDGLVEALSSGEVSVKLQ